MYAITLKRKEGRVHYFAYLEADGNPVWSTEVEVAAQFETAEAAHARASLLPSYSNIIRLTAD
ncbi:MAG: hypothetical protein ACKO0Z_25145 [Betaproteobacteria bacterium]